MSIFDDPVKWAIEKYIGDINQGAVRLQEIIRTGEDPRQLLYADLCKNKTLREFLRHFRPILAVLVENKEWLDEHIDEVMDYLHAQSCTNE